jgi:MFS family permease
MGLGAAFAAVSCFKTASLWFPAKRFALVSGMYMTAAMLGAVGGQIPLSLLVQNSDWRTALNYVGGLGVLFSLLYFLIIRDKTQRLEQVAHTRGILRNFISILANKQAWLLSLYSGLAFAPVSVFGGLWGVPFLQQAYHLNASQAAFAVSWIFIGFAVGAPFWGWFSDYYGRRKPILIFGTCLSLACLLAVLYLGFHQVWLLSSLLFLFGFGASGFFTSFAMIREVFSVLLAATVLGFMNTFDSICEALSEPLVGALLDFTWTGDIVNGIHHFSTPGYHLALLILPVYLMAALMTLYFIKETHCQPYGGA